MNGWKKILIVIGIAIVLFFAGFGAAKYGSWKSDQIRDTNYQDRITELKQLNKELESGYTKLEEDYQGAEDRLTEFLKRESERHDRALQILEGAGGKAEEASGSIGRAIAGLDRLSKAIEILLDDN